MTALAGAKFRRMDSITGQQHGCRYEPIKKNEGVIYPGALIIKTLGQRFCKRAEADATAVVLGVYCGLFPVDTTKIDNDGDLTIEVRDGIFSSFDSAGSTDAITNVHEGQLVYALNDNTLSLTDQTATLCQAGRVAMVMDDGIVLRIEAENV